MTTGRSGCGWPSAARNAGRTNTSNDTSELTGLPGSVTTGTPPSSLPAPCGPPGCIATLPKVTPRPAAPRPPLPRGAPPPRQCVLHDLVRACAHPAGGQHQVHADRPLGEHGEELRDVVRDEPEELRPRARVLDRGGEHRPVGLVD